MASGNQVTDDAEELEAFLSKVDVVNSLIRDLAVGDKDVQQDALKNADRFLLNVDEKQNSSVTTNGFSRTVINNISRKEEVFEPMPNALQGNQATMSPEQFMKEVERDALLRKRQRAEKMSKALVWKDKGNTYFKSKEFRDAVHCYTEAINLINDEKVFYTNRAQAYVSMLKFDLALEDCNTALKLDGKCCKALLHKSKALIGLHKYDEAKIELEGILKIDPGQRKLVTNFIAILEEKKSVHLQELEATGPVHDDDAKFIRENVNALRRGTSTISGVSSVVQALSTMLGKKECNQTLFRTCGGFNVFTENHLIMRVLRTEHPSSDEINLLENVIALCTNACANNGENCRLACCVDCLLASLCSRMESGGCSALLAPALRFLGVVTEVKGAKTTLLTSPHVHRLVKALLSLEECGMEIRQRAAEIINNLALEPGFCSQFHDLMVEKFVPSTLEMMASLLRPGEGTATRSEELGTKLLVIGSLCHDASFRGECSARVELWTLSTLLLSKFASDRDLFDVEKRTLVSSILGMLVNLSAARVILPQNEIVRPLLAHTLFQLIRCPYTLIVERSCCLLDRTVLQNPWIRDLIPENTYFEALVALLKEESSCLTRSCVKILTAVVQHYKEAIMRLWRTGAMPMLIAFIDGEDHVAASNAALLVLYCAEEAIILNWLSGTAIIGSLIKKASDTKLPGNVRHNFAHAAGGLAQRDQRFLEQVRSLHGLEILHEVMKANKIVQ